ncbi:MAG: competence/damage-inducible protein A [Candidatus Latescibacteria bacterium]|jgi:nicotinamide-nucleotide amidase|nr:competence/damage-inducible protein A [Candidatus Latescibacterota bacterium]
MKPLIEIIVVGNEILSGSTVDKNTPYMIDILARSGYAVSFISVVGDKLDDIADVCSNSAGRADVVLVTGGLGPTSDDRTVEGIARAFGLTRILNEDVLKSIREVFRRRKRFMSESNKKQAMIPEGAEPLDNPIGTAPGIYLKLKNNASDTGSETEIYLMPGVPMEMQAIFDTAVLSRIKATYKPSPVETATVRVTGISESQLYDTIRHLPGGDDAFAFYPRYSGIEIKIMTDEHSPLSAVELQEKVVAVLGDHVYATCDESLEEVIANMLLKNRLTIGVAESCTGGFVAHRLTNIPGSSAYMQCGVIAYSNESKQDVLRVNSELIKEHGAVSVEVAAAMAEGVRNIAGADIGISTTGIAGPGGGSAEKPLGLMYAGISSANGTSTKKLQFGEDRLINKSIMSQAVLDMLRLYLKKSEK